MIKKIVLLIVCPLFFFMHNAFAELEDMARLSLKVAGISAEYHNAYFLCLYGSGCYSLQAGNKGKTFPIHLHVMHNQTKIFLADIRTKRVFSQPITDSCAVRVQKNQKITVFGTLSVKNASPKIDNLHCEVA